MQTKSLPAFAIEELSFRCFALDEKEEGLRFIFFLQLEVLRCGYVDFGGFLLLLG
jgi:hypothetical protein